MTTEQQDFDLYAVLAQARNLRSAYLRHLIIAAGHGLMRLLRRAATVSIGHSTGHHPA